LAAAGVLMRARDFYRQHIDDESVMSRTVWSFHHIFVLNKILLVLFYFYFIGFGCSKVTSSCYFLSKFLFSPEFDCYNAAVYINRTWSRAAQRQVH
jgi:hypothetical protein